MNLIINGFKKTLNGYITTNWTEPCKINDQKLATKNFKQINYQELFALSLRKHCLLKKKSDVSNEWLLSKMLMDFGFLSEYSVNTEFQMLTTSLRYTSKIANDFAFLKNEFQDERYKKEKKIEKIWLKNFCIISRLEQENKDWDTNAVALFFDVNFKKGYVLKRIEFNNYTELNHSDNETFVSLEKVYVVDGDIDEPKLTPLSEIKKHILNTDDIERNDSIPFRTFLSIFKELKEYYNSANSDNLDLDQIFYNSEEGNFEEVKDKDWGNKFILATWQELETSWLDRNLFNCKDYGDLDSIWRIRMKKNKELSIEEIFSVYDCKVNDLGSEVDQIAKQLDQIKVDLNSIQEKLKPLCKKKEEKEEELDEIDSSYTPKFDSLKKIKLENDVRRKYKLLNEYDFLDTKNLNLDSVVQKNKNLTSDIKRTEEKCYEIEKEIKLLEENKKESKNKVSKELLEKKEKYKTIKENLKKEISDLKKQQEKLIKEIKNNISNFVSKKESEYENKKKQSIEEINNKYPELEKKISSLEEHKKKLDNNIKSLTNQLKDKENEYEKYSKKINDKKKMFEELEDKGFSFYSVSLKRNHRAPKQNDEMFSMSGLFSQQEICIDQNDPGVISKVKRYYWAFQNAIDGFYKNPYILTDLINPPRISPIKEIDANLEEVINKYHLNSKQIEAIKKVLRTNSLFYLQGPPGTGKTTSISAIIEYCCNYKSQNILITSSTHEAIANCLDKVNEMNKTNPSLIIYKKSSTTSKKINPYSSERLYSNFLEKSKNYFLSKYEVKDDNNGLLEELKQLDKKIKCKYCFYKFIEDLRDENKNEYEQQVNLEDWIYNFKKVSKDLKQFNPQANLNLYKFLKKFRDEEELEDLNDEIIPDNEFIVLAEKIAKRKDFRTLYFDIVKKGKIILRINDLIQYLENQNKPNKIDISHFKKFLDDKEQKCNDSKNINLDSILFDNKELSAKFSGYLNDNNYINLLGFTTTSATNIDINDGVSRDILFDYPIDMTIMDEVSKSSTPEILTRLAVANKFIMCGDYKQLPPNEAAPEELKIVTSMALEESEEDDLHWDHYLKLMGSEEKNDDIDVRTKEIYVEIEKLLNSPVFKNKVQAIKENKAILSNDQKAFTFLNEQHRMNSSIMSLVNLMYTGEETLKLGSDFTQEDYSFNYESGTKVWYINATNFTNKFNNDYLSENNLLGGDFKSDTKILKRGIFAAENIQKLSLGDGIINFYNCYLIINLLKKFVLENKSKNLVDKIGVICLTRNQATIIQKLVSNENELNRLKIKVDTIDNFQGREKEIIIVDFIRNKKLYSYDDWGRLKENSSEHRNLSFLLEKERINVAISRAKNMLFLVGAFDYYEKEAKGLIWGISQKRSDRRYKELKGEELE